MDRVIAYIDGFNLYYGLKSKKWQRYYWLNVQKLAQALIRDDQELILTKYFTSRVAATKSDPTKDQRQTVYLDALQTLSDFTIYEGKYRSKEWRCKKCKQAYSTYEEKMTDVNIAVEMVTDCSRNCCDVVLLLSGDSDLVPPIRTIKKEYQPKKVIVGFPPQRKSKELGSVADASFIIGKQKFRNSVFPDPVVDSRGHALCCPTSWK